MGVGLGRVNIGAVNRPRRWDTTVGIGRFLRIHMSLSSRFMRWLICKECMITFSLVLLGNLLLFH